MQRATWKIPIVVNLQRPEAVDPNAPLSRVTISNIEGGGRRIELDVTLRGDLAQIHFQQQIVHCILLEMEYRDKGELKPPISSTRRNGSSREPLRLPPQPHRGDRHRYLRRPC